VVAVGADVVVVLVVAVVVLEVVDVVGPDVVDIGVLVVVVNTGWVVDTA
jgi:hypothetical protein